MTKSLKAQVSEYFIRSVLLALFLALLINVLAIHNKAMAGFAPILIGRTIVMQGKDRVTGQVYNVPTPTLSNIIGDGLRPFLTGSSVIHVYKGDTVQFGQVTQGVDPLNIGGFSFIQVHSKGFNETTNPLNTIEYSGLLPASLGGKGPNVVWNNGGWPVFFIMASGSVAATPAVTMTGPGSDVPGNQYCQFVSTNPTVQFYVPPFVYGYLEWKFTGLTSLDFTIGGKQESFDFLRTMSCAEIAYVYNLVPSITLNGGGAANVSTTVSQGELPQGAPGATYSKETRWEISRFLLPTGAAEPGVTTNSNGLLDPCAFFKRTYGAKDCEVPMLADGTTLAKSNGVNTMFGADGSVKSGQSLPSSLTAPGSVPEGYKICYSLSVSKYKPYLDTFDAGWRNSKVVCTAGSKKPKVQILGDDIRVGGKIDTSQTETALELFGSWAQYASYSVGDVKGFGTQSGLKVGVLSGDPQANWSRLTFANAQSQYGRFNTFSVTSQSTTQIKSFFEKYAQPSTATDNSLTLSDLPGNKNPRIIDNSNATLTIRGGNSISKGKTIIIIATGNVKIAEDITYTSDALSSIGDIPQVVIIAKNIDIDKDVRHIDAWLIADYRNGTINTCDIAPAQTLTMNICDKPLHVNGPLVTNKLLLNRTYGSNDNNPGEPAEVFNNSGVAHLWSDNYLLKRYNYTSTRQTELPPRF